MIHIRGDTHNEIGQFSEAAMPGESTWYADDIVIITGDFGYVFQGEDRYISERNNLNALAKNHIKFFS